MLGVGSGVTLASWNDGEYARGTFTAGSFDILGLAASTGTFTSHPVGAPATLTFALAADASALAPGKTVYALFSVKTASGSVAGTVRLQGATYGAGTLADYLTYGVKTVSTAQCASAADYAAGTTLIADGTALNVGAAASQTVQANGANQVNYCLAVSMGSGVGNAAQSLTVSPVWQFAGTSS